MSKFKREERYLVVKLKNFNPWQRDNLKENFGRDAVKAVVVEFDWPIYEETWENIQRLAEGRETFGSEIIGLRAELAALKEENERLNSPLSELDRTVIREIFIANGFTLKPGCDDLKPYVYSAAQAIIARYTAEIASLKARVAELEALSADSLLSHFPGRHLQIDLYPSGGRIEATGCEECGGVESNFESVSWKTHLAQSFGFAVEKLKSKLDAKEPANEG